MRHLFAVFTAFAGLIVGCATMAKPKVQVYQQHAPTSQVDVWQTKAPDRPYTEIGRIEVGDTDDNYCMAQIVEQGKAMGADGVVIVGRAGSQAVAIPVGGMVYAQSGEYGLVAVAIKYK